MIEAGQTLLGPGWTAVEHFDDIDDDEYEEEEEGLDTPQPFLKIGDHIFVGAVTPLIGDEVVFDVIRHDPQKPQHRPVLTTHSRVSMREVTLIPKVAPAEQTLPELNHGMFPQRVPGEEGTPARTPKKKAEKETPARRKSTRVVATPANETPLAGSTAASTPAASGSGTPATETKKGRPRGRYTRVSLPISTMEDLMNIQLAGGLGDVRLEIAPDATPELLAQISAIRAKPTRPGDKLTKPQEDRLIRGLPATGPGSRGGRGSRGRRGTRGRRDTLFAEAEDEGEEEGDKDEGAAAEVAGSSTPAEWPASSSAGPSTRQTRASKHVEAGGNGEGGEKSAEAVDNEGDVTMADGPAESEDELREIDDDDMQALRKD
ncbi:hypothetical protein A1Q2_07548 [Trichosporon asahii var. asahii CBS 8904]|uniref:Transcription factor TFIIIC triple barrel domain-containing protein n=1 Tax=Trichosporon asahii var. asahii (strain CBS 8904) TaxID=1220162 RepID=K1VNB8_TRIAC|nr:hypothetical protein A1Q2_07548 [Trichosporon asahii var. asahii CBS 8904]